MITRTMAMNDLGVDIRLMSLRDRGRIETLMEESSADGVGEGTVGFPLYVTNCHLNPTHIWIAQNGDEVIAAISVTMDISRTANIHGLHVKRKWAATILPVIMITTALEDGRSRGGVNARLDEDIATAAAFAMLLELFHCDPQFTEPASIVTKGRAGRDGLGTDGWKALSSRRFLEDRNEGHAARSSSIDRLMSASLV